jgi:5'-nucleotidase
MNSLARRQMTFLGNRNENGESALGNLIADSQRKVMNSDFSFMNPGGIRADLQEGEVTYEELITIQPFKRKLVKMTLTGDQVRRLLNQQWQQGKVRMLQVSGLKYTWDETKPAGSKVNDIFTTDGTVLDPKARYTVTVNDYMADGGDNFTVLLEGAEKVIGPIDIDAFKTYVKQLKQPFTVSNEGRIKKIQHSCGKD